MVKRRVLRRDRKTSNEGKLFQIRAAATGIARSLTVDSRVQRPLTPMVPPVLCPWTSFPIHIPSVPTLVICHWPYVARNFCSTVCMSVCLFLSVRLYVCHTLLTLWSDLSSWWRTPITALPYWRLDANYPYLLPFSMPYGPQSCEAEHPHRLFSAKWLLVVPEFFHRVFFFQLVSGRR